MANLRNKFLSQESYQPKFKLPNFLLDFLSSGYKLLWKLEPPAWGPRDLKTHMQCCSSLYVQGTSPTALHCPSKTGQCSLQLWLAAPTSLLKTYLGGWGGPWVIPVQSLYTRLAHMLFLWKFPSPRMSRMRLPSASKYIICLCQLVIDAHETWELMQSQTFIEYLLYPYMVSSMFGSDECFEVGSSWIQIPPFVLTGWVTLATYLTFLGHSLLI